MSNILEAVNKIKNEEGAVGAVTLGIYKKASASLVLGEELPFIANTIADNFFKAACDSTIEDTTMRTWLVAKGITKIAGLELNRDIMEKLAELAVNHNGETTKEEVATCYGLITKLIK